MKTLSLLTGLLGRRCLYLCLVLALSADAFAQSESHDMITYDTVFTTGAGSGLHTWTVRITRPANMFTPNHPDTASRPVIITMPGAGEVGTNAANLRKFGPHYWLDNGWDGGVVLGNGKHYPILITILTSANNVRPLPMRACMQILLNKFHIKRNSVHVAGLSMGGMTWGRFLCFAESPGDETNMSMVKSFVSLQGIANDLSIGYNLPGWTPFGHWAKKYGGKFFGLEGVADNRGVYNARNSIRDSVSGSGYFSFEVIGGGSHCCWNDMYNPGYNNWRCVAPVTSSYIGYNGMAGKDNSMGEYKDGSSIFQWMLRQGDTSLVSSSTGPQPQAPSVNAGNDQEIRLPVSTVTLKGAASDPDGSVATVQWTQTEGPSAAGITSAGQLETTVTGLVTGTYKFQLKVTDNAGLSSTDEVMVTVRSANQLPVVNAGSPQTIALPLNFVTLNGTASDPDGTIVSKQWSKVSGPTVFSIPLIDQLLTTVTGLIAGVYEFELKVTDNEGGIAKDTVRITVNSILINDPPYASAGNDQSLTLPDNSVTLNGVASDPENNIASTLWTKVSGPAAFNIVSPGQSQTVVNGLEEGKYGFEFKVTDNGGVTAKDTVYITIAAAVQQPSDGNTVGGQVKIGLGEYQVLFIDPAGYLYGLGNISNIGVNGSGVVGVPKRVAVTPSDLKFKYAAGGLHGAAAIDEDGYLWVMGDNDQAQHGQGDLIRSLVPRKITVDANGNPFTNISSVVAWFVQNAHNGWYAVKGDGTLWTWGRTRGGMRGNGTNTGVDDLRPVQIPMPGNRKVKQIIAGYFAIALCTDGTVWTWGPASNANLGYTANGNDALSPHQLTDLRNITQVAGGQNYNYALASDGKLYGWGNYGDYMGIENGLPIYTPKELTSITSVIGSPIRKIVTNSACTQAIAEDGKLWAWGNGGQGTIGNGKRMDFNLGGNPFDRGNLMQKTPYNIAPTRKFVDVFGSSVFTMYTYAIGDDGQVYCWGRGKASVLANQLRAASPGITSSYGNDWDVAWPTPVNPFSITTSYVITAITCLSAPSGTPCNEYVIPTNVKPTAKAGPDQHITGNVATLDGTASSDNVFIGYYEWSQVSGPNTAVMDLPASKTPRVSGLVTGTYTFKLKVTDNGWYTDSSTVRVYVNVSAPANQAPVANAGNNITIALPVNSATLNGSGSDNDGNIVSYNWSYLSGPSQYSIITPGQQQTTINGLVQGVYKFVLTVTDNNGATGKDTMTVTVNPAPANQLPVASAGPNRVITLPVNSTTLQGSATDPDGSISAYSWSYISGPTQYAFGTPTQQQTAVNNLVQGTYRFELKVTDNSNGISRDTVTVTVNAAPVNQLPVADAGPNRTITLPVSTTDLQGKGTDPDGTIASYKWNYISGPSQYNIVSPTAAQTTVNNLQKGVYRFELVVTDNKGGTGRDSVTVTVNAPAPPPNQAPIAVAGPVRVITLPNNSVTLTGSGEDNDGNIISYQWKYLSGPSQYTIVTPTAAQTVVSDLVAGVYRFVLTVSDDDHATGTDTTTITVNATPPANNLPIADAGSNKVITLPVNSVTVNGSGTDQDGNIVSYKWSRVSGPVQNTIVTPAQAQTVIENLVQGVYRFEFAVTDNKGAVGKDTMTITVNAAPNQPPVAYAGGNQVVTLPVNTVTVNGNGSTDADGSITAYQWLYISGPSQYTVATPGQAQTAINNLVQGVYRFELKVTDNKGATSLDTVTITVNAAPVPNQPPIAYTGANQSITLPVNTVTVNGSGSNDADGTIAAYEWSYVSGPAQYTIVTPAQAQTAINNLVQGIYKFRLKVTDNKGATGSDTLTITVNAAPLPNQAPVAVASNDVVITIPASVATVNGSSSFDPDGSIASYKWTYLSGPAGYVIGSPAAVQTSISNLKAGTYKFELAVTDNKGAIGRDTVTIIVNTPPVSMAGVDVVITLPTSSLTLNGASSYDPDGIINTYQWTKITGPSQYTIATPTQKQTLISNLTQGTYKFELRITDNRGAVGRDTVMVIVNPGNTTNQLPAANAGNNIVVQLPVNTTTLNGIGVDPDGVIAAYRWTKIAGPACVIASPEQARTAVSNLVAGIYSFELKVTDNKGGIGKDTVTVTVKAPVSSNLPPVADAGEKITAGFDVTVRLDGSKSYDPDGKIASYFWSLVSGPASAPVNIVSPSSVQTDVTGLPPGDYVFRLVVKDNTGATDTTEVEVEILPAESKIVIFPNPATQYIDVQIQSSTHRNKTTLAIINASGSQVFGEQFMREQPSIVHRVDVTRLVPGVYYVKVQVDINHVVTEKFIKLP